jgi:hypothetical protein
MARLRSTIGKVGNDVALTTRFYVNGQLFDPYDISSVEIYDAETGGNLIAALSSPAKTSVGVYQTSWSIPVGTAPAVFYDRWTWQAASDISVQIRTYALRVDGSYTPGPPGRLTGPLFVTPKEISFFNHMSKELIQRIISQKIIYYAVSEEHTKTHGLYAEAIRKTTYEPIEVNALVLYKNPTQSNTQFTIDTIYSIECYFHIHELREREVIPREGDFVQFGTVVYEIETLSRPQITYGQIDNEVMVKAECRVSRKSQFEIINSGD